MISTALLLSLAAPLASAAAVKRQAMDITSYERSPISWAYPEGRGFASSDAADAPCGGQAPGTRADYPLTGGEMSFLQLTDVHNVNILYALEAQPDKFHDFSTFTNSITSLGAGHYCAPGPDFSSLGGTVGQDVTLLAIYQLDETTRDFYYQCADVRLVESAGFVQPEHTCGNFTTNLDVASADDSLKLNGDDFTEASGGNSGYTDNHPVVNGTDDAATATDSSSSSASSSSTLSPAAGGGIGAAVAVVVLAALAAAAYFAGYVRFGKQQKKRAVTGDNVSETSSMPNMKA